LRSLAPQKLPPPDMMKQLNRLFLERKIEGHFITLTYAIWEPRIKSLCLANAGMPLPILVRKGQCRAIRAEGVPLGLLEHTEYQPVTVNLETGDLLAFFSDGITEPTTRGRKSSAPGAWKAFYARTPRGRPRKSLTGCLQNSAISKPGSLSATIKHWLY